MAERKNKKGKKGDGCIFKVGQIYYYKNNILGIKRTSLKVKTLKEAQEIVRDDYLPLVHVQSKNEVLIKIAENKTLIKKTCSVSLNNVFEKFEKNPARAKISLETLALYRSHWNHFQNWISKAHPEISQIGQIDERISKEYAIVLDSAAPAQKTFNDYITHLSIIFRHVLGKREAEEVWGADIIKKETPQYHSRREFTEADMQKIWDVFKNENYIIKDKEQIELIFYIGAYTGLRLKDCVLLEYGHVRFNQNLISTIPYKNKSKTQQRVFIPLHPVLKEKLLSSEKWKEKGTDFFLPESASRYKRNKWALNQSCLRVIKKAGFEVSIERTEEKKINQYGFSSLRHSFVSFCANAGVPLPVVQAIVGHNCSSVTRYYVHISQESMQKAIDSLPGSDKKTNSKNRLLEQIQNMSEEQIQKLLLLSRKV